MLPWDRLKPLAGAGIVGAAALTWVLVFQTGWSNSDWNSEWSPPTALRGKTVVIHNKKVETTAEREKRLEVKYKEVHEGISKVKKDLLGDARKTRGNDIQPEAPELPPGFDYSPRESCLQLKMEYPERFGDADCMADKYNNPDPWWQVGIDGQ